MFFSLKCIKYVFVSYVTQHILKCQKNISLHTSSPGFFGDLLKALRKQLADDAAASHSLQPHATEMRRMAVTGGDWCFTTWFTGG